MTKSLEVMALVIAASGLAMACGVTAPTAPEISAASGVSALVLLSGALVVLRGRRKNSSDKPKE
jgi:hypothetical protein